jgi:NAD(P) transhydrogenase subunit beta
MTAGLAAYGVPVLYIASAVFFIMGLKLMCRVRSVGRGGVLLGIGFLLAVLGIAIEAARLDPKFALIGLAGGVLLGLSLGYVTNIDLRPSVGPLLAAAGGITALLLGIAVFLHQESWPLANDLALSGGVRGAAVGLAVVSGAFALAFGLLAGFGPAARGAGRPAVVALAASASGLAAAMMGFALGNPIVVAVGGLTTTAGLSLSSIVANALGSKPLDVAFGTLGRRAGDEYSDVKACGPEETAMVLESARKVIFVPGYGMAVAQAQHALADLGKMLEARGAKVLYAIHPVAGLIPGHINILLDEAKIDTAQILEWEAANRELADTDVALAVGANDIVNPDARGNSQSAVFGMPFVDVGRAAAVFVLKRSLRPGAAGVKNPLFERPNTNMVFGDAKKVLQAIGVELKAQAPRKAA